MKNFLVLLTLILILSGCNKNQQQDNIKAKEEIEKNEEIKEEVKELTIEDYQNNSVNELGEVPIMMYHGIHHKNNSDTEYTGGNVDKDGYQRTSEAFRNDLEFYYQNGYRMIRLTDYVDGNIDVELGKSPIILTFDDGLSNNIKVTGLDENGDIIIDPNSAVGILESFKEKYPDFNVTATFFVNGGLFEQEEYNKKILNWLVDNGYDIGNHTYTHVNFSNVDSIRTQEEVGKVYELLDEIIPEKYVNIIALPFGSPYNLEHDNIQYILNTNYNGKTYETKSALRVGWKAESSPFSIDFNSKFLKRIRAYDNNGIEFDIEMNFKLLEDTRYISDGNANTVVIPSSSIENVSDNYQDKIINY